MMDLNDPFEAYNGLSLYSRVFSSLPSPPNLNNSDDIYSIHNILKSMPVQNPEKLIKQAKLVLDSSLEPPNTEMAKDVASKDKNEDVAEEIVESPRGRRPGLGRKRARFSLLPASSQAAVNLEPTLDIDKLNNPEEFFMAFERLENAKKEIAKQTGHSSSESHQFNTSMSERPRRQGIPGRSRSVKYKHLYPTMSSQEMFEEEIAIPITLGLQQDTAQPAVVTEERKLEDVASHQKETTDVALEEAEMAGSVANIDNRVYKILHDLLARDDEELDGDGALNLLQDQLEIKSHNIEKLDLPELQDIRTLDLNTSGEKLPKVRNVLSDIQNFLKGTKSRTPMKQKNAESLVPSLGSPTPPKSPLTLLSSLKTRVFQSNLSSDPFSAVDINESHATNSSPSENIDRCCDLVDERKEMSFPSRMKQLMIEEENNAASNTHSLEVAARGFGCPPDAPMDDNLPIPPARNVGPIRSFAELEDNNVGLDETATNEDLSRPDTDADVQIHAPNELQARVEDMLQEGVTSPQANLNMDEQTGKTLNQSPNQFGQSSSAVIEDHQVDGCSQAQGNASDQTQETTSEQHNEKVQEPSLVSIDEQAKPKSQLNRGHKRKNVSKRKRIAVEDHTMDEDHEIQGTALGQSQGAPPKQHNEKVQEPSVASLNVKTKPNSQPRKVRKDKAARNSLAVSGMSWEDGVRRSTRIRSRPLEYWKGERFLYGRIHDSLATVIGIKYESPGKGTDEKPTIKVKSFVSNEYEHLLKLAAQG